MTKRSEKEPTRDVPDLLEALLEKRATGVLSVSESEQPICRLGFRKGRVCALWMPEGENLLLSALREKGRLSEETLAEVMILERERGIRMARILVEMGAIRSDEIGALVKERLLLMLRDLLLREALWYATVEW